MAKVKTTAKFDILELVKGFMNSRTQDEVGNAVVDEAKKLISEGQSPVRGYGRFERYKDRTKYPGSLKSARPVNLYLTGEMLAGFSFRKRADGVVEAGMVKGSSDRKEIAAYHNEGTPNMAQRRIVPGEGEEWTISIMRKIRDVYEKRLSEVIRQSNKKK
jgi:hypothetical protein